MNTFVATIDIALADKLREDLVDQGFEMKTVLHAIFSAQKEGVSCTLYKSGKLMVQGKKKDEFIAYYLEPEVLKDFSYSYPKACVDKTPHMGIDEAGKGDFFGSLCIAGVYADGAAIEKLLGLGVKDSKKMADSVIEALAKEIKKIVPYAVIAISPKKYNELYPRFQNLNRLLSWGHASVIEQLVEKTGCREVLIDKFGDESLVIGALKKKSVIVNLTQRHRAEEDVVVAAASILAREAFVIGIRFLSREAGFEIPKGASTAVVIAAQKLIHQMGKGVLEKFVKVHFKTYFQVLPGEKE
jgi:ribonuclease HIII